jgi:hypothetical protein
MEENLPAVYNGGTLADAVGNDLPKALELVKNLADAEGLPKHLAKKPASFLLYLQISQEFKIGLMAAVANFYVVNGNLTARSDFMIDRARMFGHQVKHEIKGKGRDTVVTTVIVRREDLQDYKALRTKLIDALGDEAAEKKIRDLMAELEHRCTWDWKKATLAQVTDKSTWQNYPDAMLRHRSDSQCVRMACGEVLGAAQYTPEEMGASVNEDGSYNISSLPAAQKMAAPAVTAGQSRPAQPKTDAPVVPVTAVKKPVTGTVVSTPSANPARTAAPAAPAPATITATAVATKVAVVEDKKPTTGTAVSDLPKINGHTNPQDLFSAVYDLVSTTGLAPGQMQEIEKSVAAFRLNNKLVTVPTQDGKGKTMMLARALKELTVTAKLG